MENNPKNKNNGRILGFIVIFLVIAVLAFLFAFGNPNKVNSKINDKYNLNNLLIPGIINYTKENNITIYGSTTCPVCKKQFEEFGDYGAQLLLENRFIYCDKVDKNVCSDLKFVPSWKKNGELIFEGYIPLEKIKETLNDTSK